MRHLLVGVVRQVHLIDVGRKLSRQTIQEVVEVREETKI